LKFFFCAQHNPLSPKAYAKKRIFFVHFLFEQPCPPRGCPCEPPWQASPSLAKHHLFVLFPTWFSRSPFGDSRLASLFSSPPRRSPFPFRGLRTTIIVFLSSGSFQQSSTSTFASRIFFFVLSSSLIFVLTISVRFSRAIGSLGSLSGNFGFFSSFLSL